MRGILRVSLLAGSKWDGLTADCHACVWRETLGLSLRLSALLARPLALVPRETFSRSVRRGGAAGFPTPRGKIYCLNHSGEIFL